MNTNLMNEFTRQYMKAEGKWFDLRWHYVPGCIMKSYLDLYEVTENNEYLDFVKSYIDRLFDEKDNPSVSGKPNTILIRYGSARPYSTFTPSFRKRSIKRLRTEFFSSSRTIPAQRRGVSGTRSSTTTRYGLTDSTWGSPSTCTTSGIFCR